ncbi:hypothetical protein R6242_20280 [Iodobacter sp. CM08]|uniref:hypothetical protein n=1 Tax=Iodobacter sp. CM08 TaxID=3085902 RepID=UPI002980F2FE|nr:hypothetical protein [Iodobacter sp. CM08]MDW5418913.1 hypothetical protein [Iodobacter sp. CM08]
MKNQPLLKIGIIANHDVKIKDAHFHNEIFQLRILRVLIVMSVMIIILSLALGFVVGKEYFLPRAYEERMMHEETLLPSSSKSFVLKHVASATTAI